MRWTFLPVSLLFILLAAPLQAQPIEQRVHRSAVQTLLQQYPVTKDELAVQVQQVEGLRSTSRALRTRFNPSEGIPRGRTQVELLTGSQKVGWHKVGWALLYITRFDSVMVSQRSISSGQTVKPSDLQATRRDVTRLRTRPLTPQAYRQQQQKGALVAASYLSEGEILEQQSLRQPYTVETGDLLTINYKQKDVSVRLRCKARQAGYIGDVIRVSCRSTGALYRVRLTPTGTATWLETL